MIASTAHRVAESTAEYVNERIREATEERVGRIAAAGPPAIERRLKELDEEWDIERTLETNFALVVLAGFGLGEFVDRRWNWLPAVAAGFMVQHALQGWCPPIEVFRRLGIRTQAEIERERYALKAIRGDFENVSQHHSDGRAAAREALESAS